MKNIFIRYSALAALLVSFAAFTGCKEEALDTDQYGDGGVRFTAFAPNPAMRGGELRILGSNLQDVKEIRLQGGVSVTDYTVVKSGTQAEIRFTVPLEGPQPGKISVVDRDGVEYSSLSELSFTEAIGIDSFAPSEVLSGDVITITGEYLNIVKEVIFEGDAYVTEFESQSRHQLQVKVPANAISGFIRVSDVNELVDQNSIPNTVYASEELEVGDPTVTFTDKGPYKLGDVIVIDGEHLDMIETIDLQGATDVDFTVNDEATQISIVLPATATDGPVLLYSYGAKLFTAGKIETVSVADLQISSIAEDGRYKSGTEVEISGSDLDLVDKLTFVNAEASFSYRDGKIYTSIPAAAKDGAVTVTLESGKQARTPEIEVVKPVITSLSATEAVAGKTELEIYGTDLDLAVTVKIGNETESFIECAYQVKDNGTLTVQVSDQAYTGPLTVVAENGYESVSEEVSVSYDNAVSIKFTKPSYSSGRDITIEGSNLQNIETISIKGKKVTNFTSRSNEAMAFGIPDGVGPGVYRLVLTLVDGSELTWPVPFEITAPYTETFIWEGSEDLSGWGNSPYLGTPNAFQDAGIAEGDVIRVYFTAYNDWWQFKNLAGHWDELSIAELDGGSTVNTDNFDTSSGYFAFNVTADILAKLTNQDTGWGGAYQCQGEGVIITGVSLVHYGATEKVVWEGSEYTGPDYDNNLQIGTEDDWVNAGLEEGCEIRLYFTAESETEWQIQLFDGHWNALNALNLPGAAPNQFNAENSPEAISKGYVSFKATGEIYTALTTKAWWGYALICQGKGITFTKFTFM